MTITQDKLMEWAVQLLDFCGGYVTMKDARVFFRDSDLTKAEQNRVVLQALTLSYKTQTALA